MVRLKCWPRVRLQVLFRVRRTAGVSSSRQLIWDGFHSCKSAKMDRRDIFKFTIVYTDLQTETKNDVAYYCLILQNCKNIKCNNNNSLMRRRSRKIIFYASMATMVTLIYFFFLNLSKDVCKYTEMAV